MGNESVRKKVEWVVRGRGKNVGGGRGEGEM
jgi:hypothetical protein